MALRQYVGLLDIAVALVNVSGAVEAVTEELGFWPFRRDQILDELSGTR